MEKGHVTLSIVDCWIYCSAVQISQVKICKLRNSRQQRLLPILFPNIFLYILNVSDGIVNNLYSSHILRLRIWVFSIKRFQLNWTKKIEVSRNPKSPKDLISNLSLSAFGPGSVMADTQKPFLNVLYIFVLSKLCSERSEVSRISIWISSEGIKK